MFVLSNIINLIRFYNYGNIPILDDVCLYSKDKHFQSYFHCTAKRMLILGNRDNFQKSEDGS